jgi:hypothetical protein
MKLIMKRVVNNMKYVEVTSATPQIKSHIERSLRDALKEDEIKFTITKGDSSSEHDWIVNCTTDKLFDICKKLGFKSWKVLLVICMQILMKMISLQYTIQVRQEQ